MLADTVRDFIEEHALLPERTRVVAGLSGGLDSVVLVHLLRRLDYAVTAAHVNYGLREAADGDEAFVRRYCKSFDPPMALHVARRDAQQRADRRGESLQEAARRQRYAFFEKMARQAGVGGVAVGHHRDDQAETLLLNLMRGSGPEGLAGMRTKRLLGRERGEDAAVDEAAVHLVRPFLSVARQRIEEYAEAHGLSWRRDRANRDARYKRAALRRDVLPALEAHFPGAAERLARTAGLVGRYVDQALRPELRRRFDAARRTSESDEGSTRGSAFSALDVETLRSAAPIWRGRLLLEALRRWCPGAPRTQGVARELEKLLAAQPGRRTDLGAWRVWRERGVLRFTQAGSAGEKPQPLASDRPARWPGGRLRVELLPTVPERLDTGPHVAQLDADRLSFPLVVRPWQPGDRLQPLGMAGRKKVSDLLTDARVPPSERRGVRVVCSDGAVVWVVGHRLAEPAKVRAGTRRVARFTFEPSAAE
jgi:tRNA(Ile)-lysidine synthase